MKRMVVLCTCALWIAFSGGGTALAVEAGAPMPEIGLSTLSGKPVTAKSLRGKVVVVDFWATWCAPCKEELPVLQKLYKKYSEKGLVVIGVSVDRDADNLKDFLNKLGVSFPIVHDGEHAVSERYKPAKMPSSFIIDRKGVVRHVHAGFNASDAPVFEKEIAALL